MHKSGNMVQKGAQMGATIEKTLIKMRVQKYMEFLSTRRAVDGRPGIGGGDFWGSLLVRFNILGIYTGCLTYRVYILGIHILGVYPRYLTYRVYILYIYWAYILVVYPRYDATARVTPSRKRGGGFLHFYIMLHPGAPAKGGCQVQSS